jgi:hypothetical protein
VSSLEPLKKLRLKGLSFSDTPVRSLEPLRGMQSLTYLSLDRSEVRDLGPIAKLEVSILHIDGLGLSTLEDLRGMASLQTLRCEGNQLSDLEGLRGMASLQTLNCGGNQLSDLSGLAGLKLTKLNANNNHIEDLGHLKDIPLKELDIDNNRIHDLSPLKDLPLEVLVVRQNRIRDLGPLAGLRLNVLLCQGNPLASLAPFLEKPPPRAFLFSSEEMSESAYESAIAVWRNDPARANDCFQAEVGLALKRLAEAPRADTAARESALASLKALAKAQGEFLYLPIYGNRNWQEARDHAQTLGGELATVETPELQAWLCAGFPTFKGWIGGYTEDGSTFQWIDGRPWNYQAFDTSANFPRPQPRSGILLDTFRNSWQNYPESDFHPQYLIRWPK